MTRSVDIDEAAVLEAFWPFQKALQEREDLSTWQECPFATTNQEIDFAETALWFPFPDSYRLFLLAWNGFNVPCHGDVRQDIAFLCCCNLALTKERPREVNVPEYADIIRGNAARFRWERQPSNMVNFAGDRFGNAYGFLIGEAGPDERIAYWSHDGEELTIVGRSFTEWFNGLPGTIAQRL